MDLLDAFVNVSYLKESIWGEGVLEGTSRARVNPKLNEQLVSNLFLKHYIHYQIFRGFAKGQASR